MIVSLVLGASVQAAEFNPLQYQCELSTQDMKTDEMKKFSVKLKPFSLSPEQIVANVDLKPGVEVMVHFFSEDAEQFMSLNVRHGVVAPITLNGFSAYSTTEAWPASFRLSVSDLEEDLAITLNCKK